MAVTITAMAEKVSVRSCRVVMSCGMAMVVSRNVYAESRELVTLSPGRSRRTGKRGRWTGRFTDALEGTGQFDHVQPVMVMGKRVQPDQHTKASFRVQLQQARKVPQPKSEVPGHRSQFLSLASHILHVLTPKQRPCQPTSCTRSDGTGKRADEAGAAVRNPCVEPDPMGQGCALLVAVSPSVRFQFR